MNIESALSSFDLKAYGQTEGGKVGSERVIEVEDGLSIESAVPFERVIQVQVCHIQHFQYEPAVDAKYAGLKRKGPHLRDSLPKYLNPCHPYYLHQYFDLGPYSNSIRLPDTR